MRAPYAISLIGVWLMHEDKAILKDITMSVERGEFVTIYGPPSSGKTVLIKVIIGVLKPTKGRVVVLGRSNIEAVRKMIGYIPQEPELIPHLSVFDNIALPLKIRWMRRKDVGSRVRDIAQLLDLDLEAEAYRLSWSEMKKVAVARAIVGEPELVLADEPEDVETLRKLNENGTTVLLASRSIKEGKILEIEEGQLKC